MTDRHRQTQTYTVTDTETGPSRERQRETDRQTDRQTETDWGKKQEKHVTSHFRIPRTIQKTVVCQWRLES